MSGIRGPHDGCQITIFNDALMYKFMYNSIGIHIVNEPSPKVVKNLLSCMEWEESQYTTGQHFMHIADYPLATRSSLMP